MCYFYNENDKCYFKVITCNSPCHHPLEFFFRININCPGARLSCSEPEATYAEVTWAISEKKADKNYEFKTIKHCSNFSTSLLYIPGFLFDVPDLLALPKLCKEKTCCFIIF